MTHRSDLTTEIEKALTDEVYDGASGTLNDEQLRRYIRRLAEAAVEVVEEDRALTMGGRLLAMVAGAGDVFARVTGLEGRAAEVSAREQGFARLVALGVNGEQLDELGMLCAVGADAEMLRALREVILSGMTAWQLNVLAAAMRATTRREVPRD
ncbi:hypothetical protein ACLBWV_03690 [Microbacterium paraoxydans]